MLRSFASHCLQNIRTQRASVCVRLFSSEPGTFCDDESDQCAPQKQSLPCASTDLPRTNTELPQLCAVPKKRLSIQRRANRRTAYWLRRKEVVAQCSHCGQVGLPDSWISGATGSTLCTGQCMAHVPRQVQYAPEYRPPC